MKLFLSFLAATAACIAQINISGAAADAATGKPLAQAEVVLRGIVGVAPKTLTATTNAEGKFAFAGATPNSYFISTRLEGYVLLSATGCPNLMCDVKSSIGNLQLRLVHEGVIAGKVVDNDNHPVPHATVSVSSGGFFSGARATNENGEFRIGGLTAGSYRLYASTLTDFTQARKEDGETHLADAVMPRKLEVRAGSEVSDVEIVLKPHPVVRVSGTVSGYAGADTALIKLMRGTQQITTGVRAHDGKFEIWRLSPGEYTISALAAMYSGPFQFTVGDKDIDNVEVPIAMPQAYKGKVVWDHPPEGVAGKALSLNFTDTITQPIAFTARVHVESDGRFEAPASPQRFLVRLDYYPGIPRSTYVKSIRIGSGKEQSDPVLDTRRPIRGEIQVTLSANGGEVSGTVINSKGVAVPKATVVLMGPASEGTQRFHMAAADSAGHFVYEGVAPGTYRLAAVDASDVGEFDETGSLGAYERTADKVDVHEFDKVKRVLRRQ